MKGCLKKTLFAKCFLTETIKSFLKKTEKRTKYEAGFAKPNLEKFDLVEVKSSRVNDHASILYALKTHSRNIKNADILGDFDIKVVGRINYLPLVLLQ